MKNNSAQKFSPNDLLDLDTFLRSQTNNMSLVKAHGFLTAVVSFPELIMPSEWLPILIGQIKRPIEQSHTRLMLNKLIAIYRQISDSLSSNYSFEFIFSPDQPYLTLDSAPYSCIQEWCNGYCLALVWNESEWLHTKEEFITQACATFFMLTELIKTDKQQPYSLEWQRDKQQLIQNLPDLVKGLYTYWSNKQLDNCDFILPPAYLSEPCPCGSKKTYTNCCLLEVADAVLH